MSTCLFELVFPHIGEIDRSEVANHLKTPCDDVLELKFWPFVIRVKVQGRGELFVSPRKLSFWLPAIKKAIACSRNLDGLEELKKALEVDFKTKYNRKTKQAIYSGALQAELRQLIEQRRQQIEVETADLRQAEGLTQSYEFITAQCNEQESLDAVGQLIRKNYSIFEPFPYLLQHLRRVWAHRRMEILSYKAA